MHEVDRCRLLLQIQRSLSVQHDTKLYKNGWTDQGATGVWTPVYPRNHVLGGGSDLPRGRGNSGASLGPLQTHTHTHLMALFPQLPGSASTRKVKPIWILLKQETVSSSGISWAMCKSASRSRQITMPVLHHSKVFLQTGCPSCHPTNSVKALKAPCKV